MSKDYELKEEFKDLFRFSHNGNTPSPCQHCREPIPRLVKTLESTEGINQRYHLKCVENLDITKNMTAVGDRNG